MNDNIPDSNNTTQSVPPIIPPCFDPPQAHKRRWWRWAIFCAGGLFLAIVLGVLMVAGYWRSMVRNYTATAPAELPEVVESQSELEDLFYRWVDFRKAVQDGTPAKPLRLSADDLNQLLLKNVALKDHLRLMISNSQVFGVFSFPLDKTRRHELKGRYLNGLARLNLEIQDGWVSLRVADMQANGKAMPKWLLKKFQRQNLAKGLEDNIEAAEFLRKLDTVSVDGEEIVFVPLARN